MQSFHYFLLILIYRIKIEKVVARKFKFLYVALMMMLRTAERGEEQINNDS